MDHSFRGDTDRAFAASRGRRASGDGTDSVAIVCYSNRSLAAKCSSHTRWRSVRKIEAEQDWDRTTKCKIAGFGVSEIFLRCSTSGAE